MSLFLRNEVLDQKLPEPARELWDDLERISEQVHKEIEDQIGAMLADNIGLNWQ